MKRCGYRSYEPMEQVHWLSRSVARCPLHNVMEVMEEVEMEVEVEMAIFISIEEAKKG